MGPLRNRAAATLERSRRVLEKRLQGERHATRDELARELAHADLPVTGEALAYQLMAAELDARISSATPHSWSSS